MNRDDQDFLARPVRKRKRDPWVKAMEHANNYGWSGTTLMKWIRCEVAGHGDLEIIPFDDDNTCAMARCTNCGHIVTILTDDPGPELGINPS